MIYERFIDECIYIGGFLISSNYLYCYIIDKNFINIYYNPSYMVWMSITYGILLFRYKKILI